jgi:hypothetical protein
MTSVRRLALLAIFCNCTPKPPSVASPPAAGISIALYSRMPASRKEATSEDAYSVVDDRRWVEISGSALDLDHVDPGAALASLVIEPLADPVSSLRVRHCTRDRIPRLDRAVGPPGHRAVADPSSADNFAPAVHCTVEGKPGRYLIRILYVSTSLAYKAQHDIAMTGPDRATVTTRFAIETPPWRESATVALFDGVPGGDHPPREVARGTITLDGNTSVIAVPAREVAAQIRRVFDGALIVPDVASTDSMWGRESVQAIWVWLELAALSLAPGPVRVHLELPGEPMRDIDVPAEGRRQVDSADAPLRLPLWVDDTLHGMRQRFVDLGAAASESERFLLSVANLGDTARDVWIEEHVRPAHHRRVERAWPQKPAFYSAGAGLGAFEVLRSKVHVMPGKIERVGYTIAYDP